MGKHYLDDYGLSYVVHKIKEFISGSLSQRMLDRDVTVYVSTTGSDDTGNGSSANPYKTIQKAVDMCPPICNPYRYNIVISNGSYLGANIVGKDICLMTTSTSPEVYVTSSIVVTRGGKVFKDGHFKFLNIVSKEGS